MLLGLATGAQAQGEPTATTAAGGPTIPPAPIVTAGPSKGKPKGLPYVEPFDPVTSTVSRSKIHIKLKNLMSFLWSVACVYAPPFNLQSCPGNPIKLPTIKGPGPLFYQRINAPVWVISPPSASQDYGVFPAVRVHLLAFGSVPATATVHIRQTVHNNLIDPLKLHWLSSGTAVPAGTEIGNLGPAPAKPGPGHDWYWADEAHLEGPVDIRLSDVAVDGVPLEVGPRCHTNFPATLTLTVPEGYYDSNILGTVAPKGEPGSFIPTNSNGDKVAGWLTGNVEIPKFSGCANNLDPLVSAMASGRRNPVEAYSPHAIVGCTFHLPGFGCPPYPGSGNAAAIAAQAEASPMLKRPSMTPMSSTTRERLEKLLASLPKHQAHHLRELLANQLPTH